MIKRRILVALLTVCLTITSCISFVPQVWAETAESGIESNQPAESDQPVEPELPEDPNIPESDQPVKNDWDEQGFYRDENGKIVKEAYLFIEGHLFYFNYGGFGKWHTGEYKNLYYKDGLPFTGWLQGLRYKGGKPLTGWYNNKYYKSGSLLTGIKLSDKGVPIYYTNGLRDKSKNYIYKNKRYVNGKLYNGVYKSYYFNKGVKITKHKNKVRKMSDGKFYCFNKNGTVFKGTGWKRFDSKRYYIKKGKVYTGWHYVGKYKYYFRKDNASLCQDLISLQGSKWKKRDLFIKVNRTKNIVTIYAKDGDKGYTIPVKALACSVGKKKSPTITGTYTLKSGSGLTYRWHTLGGPGISPYCYGQYCVRIHKSWLFHSVTYDKPDNMTLQTYTYNQLGSAASHGCVRLQVKDAKLIYDIVNNRNTKVKIYDSDYAGPFDKPVIKKIPKGQKYDPTDVSVKK